MPLLYFRLKYLLFLPSCINPEGPSCNVEAISLALVLESAFAMRVEVAADENTEVQLSDENAKTFVRSDEL